MANSIGRTCVVIWYVLFIYVYTYLCPMHDIRATCLAMIIVLSNILQTILPKNLWKWPTWPQPFGQPSAESKAPKCRAGCPTRRLGAASGAGRSPSGARPFPPWSSPGKWTTDQGRIDCCVMEKTRQLYGWKGFTEPRLGPKSILGCELG